MNFIEDVQVKYAGAEELLRDIANKDTWGREYVLEEPLRIPGGAIVEATIRLLNSARIIATAEMQLIRCRIAHDMQPFPRRTEEAPEIPDYAMRRMRRMAAREGIAMRSLTSDDRKRLDLIESEYREVARSKGRA